MSSAAVAASSTPSATMRRPSVRHLRWTRRSSGCARRCRSPRRRSGPSSAPAPAGRAGRPATRSRCRSRRWRSARRARGCSCSSWRARSGSARNESSVTSMRGVSGGRPACVDGSEQPGQEQAAEQLRRRAVHRHPEVQPGSGASAARRSTPSRTTASDSAGIRPARRASGRNATGRSRPSLGVLPAHQRLERRAPPGGRVDLRLVPDHELAVGDPAAQLLGQPQPLAGEARPGRRRRAARRPRVPSPRTSRRRPGAAGRSRSGRLGRAHRDADRRPDRQVEVVHLHRGEQRLADVLARSTHVRSSRSSLGDQRARTRRRPAGRPGRLAAARLAMRGRDLPSTPSPAGGRGCR